MLTPQKIQKPSDITWYEVYPNNIPENGIEEYKAEIYFSKDSFRRYTIKLQKAAYKEENMNEKIKEDLKDPDNPTNIINYGCRLVTSEIEYYILFEQIITIDENGKEKEGKNSFVRVFNTLEEAKYRAFLQYRIIRNLKDAYCRKEN